MFSYYGEPGVEEEIIRWLCFLLIACMPLALFNAFNNQSTGPERKAPAAESNCPVVVRFVALSPPKN